MGVFLKKKIGNNITLGIWLIEDTIDWYFSNKNIDKEVIKRARGIKNTQKALQALSVHLLIKELICPETKLQICYYESGKPYFKGFESNLSISHSKEMVAVILSSEKETGIDIEKINSRIERISEKFMTELELQTARCFDKNRKLEYMHLIWGAKEAMYKLYGYGGLEFKTNLLVSPFKFKREGEFKGLIKKENFFQEVNGYYEKINEYMLVFVTAD